MRLNKNELLLYAENRTGIKETWLIKHVGIARAMASELVNSIIENHSENHFWPIYQTWPNICLGEMEDILRRAGALPLFYRYSHFDLSTEALYFLPLPFHYIRSWRQRFKAKRISLFVKIERLNNKLQRSGL